MESLAVKISLLKKEKKAVILAHNYQRAEVQEIADYVGDSLGLSLAAAKTEAAIIVFCGVDFMAETAAIISPGKKVIIPDSGAGCPMAEMIDVEKLQALKNRYPGRPVVCYVNSSAAVKAESDICCTSANAIKVVASLREHELIFVPDKFLGRYVQERMPNKKLILYEGYCPTHAKILPEQIKKLKKEHPDAVSLVHPECRPETIAAADGALSTDGMLKYAQTSEASEFIIGTETGIIHRLQKENPKKRFYPATDLALCPNMKLTTLEKIFWALADEQTEVKVAEEVVSKARQAIEKMLMVGRQD